MQNPHHPIKGSDDLRFQEWAECRSTIARFDTILVDLRKMGFAFITALLTASAFLSLLGIPGQNAAATPVEARAAAFVAIMVLIAALFAVDSYYGVLLSGAVERALDIEPQTDPPVRITKYLSINAAASLANKVTLILYLILQVTAGGLGVLAAGARVSASGDFSWKLNTTGNVLLLITFLLCGLMAFYWSYAAAKTGFDKHKKTRTWRPGEAPLEKVAAP